VSNGKTSESSNRRNSKRLDKLNIKIQVNQDEAHNADHGTVSSHSISSHIADTALSAPHCLNKRKKPENFHFNGIQNMDYMQYTPVPYSEKLK
jgi:hypothetical protein